MSCNHVSEFTNNFETFSIPNLQPVDLVHGAMDGTSSATISRDLHDDNQLSQIAHDNWIGLSKPIARVRNEVISQIWELLVKDEYRHTTLQVLENLQTLERYLWPGFNANSNNQHVLLIAFILNVKRSENLPAWDLLDRRADFSTLFRRFLSLSLDTSLPPRVRTHLLVTLIGAFQSIDSGLIRKECAPLVSISIWCNLHTDTARDRILERYPQLKKAWKAAGKRFEGADKGTQTQQRFERAWLYTLVLDFVDILYDDTRQTPDIRVYCERFMELLTDLQSQFPTRRFVNTLLQDLNLLVVTKQSPYYRDEGNALFRDFHLLLRHYTFFPIDDHTGSELSRSEVSDIHTGRLAQLQRIALKHYPEKLKLLVLANYGSLEKRDELHSHLESLADEDLEAIAKHIGYRVDYPSSTKVVLGRPFLLELLLSAHERKPTFREILQSMSLLPTEQSLYEASFLRNDSYTGARPLALPKVNLQYLTTGDFLWRSFILFRCESFYEIRKDMEEVVKRLQPRQDISSGQTRFSGHSRMACQISKPAIVEVAPPKVGEDSPAVVKAEITLDLSRMNDAVRSEWDSLRPDDVVFLLYVKAKDDTRMLTNGNTGSRHAEQSFQFLRAAEVSQVLDDNGKPMRVQDKANGYNRRSRQRRLVLRLDTKSYQEDLANKSKGHQDPYEHLNFVVRRKGRENNFKSMLESIARLALSDVALPQWIQDVFLGLGDPAGATYTNLPNALRSVDFRDTFLDWQHLQDSFPGKSIRGEGGQQLQPPYVLTNLEQEEKPGTITKKRRRDGGDSQATSKPSNDTVKGTDSDLSATRSRKRRRDELDEESALNEAIVSTYKPLNMGPYPTDEPKINSVRFTPAQVEAIQSGTQPGLTVIVGPPGTGKTDVATQIINNIYHNFPNERTLLVAHSNQALNQLFQKIIALDIDERHLLRLGHGEGELELESDVSYSKHGRVESFLELGSRYLAEVSRLAASMNAPGAHGDSCETAYYFNMVYVKPVWTHYWNKVDSSDVSAEVVVGTFPFHAYFVNAPQPLFPSDASKETVLEIAHGCYRHIEKIFKELEDIGPFEILRTPRDRANYLLVKEARIIAMTTTHAAMRRQEIADLGFHYENIVMEEAAQVTEIENFIPLALQHAKDGSNPLKRVVLVGDHLQNSPVVQNLAFRQYANLEQSLFLRLVRLGVPTIMLDKQGRARPSLASLYSWRYKALGDLPAVTSVAEFKRANAGLRYESQFIDVPDYKGKGEMEPTPHFVQNLGEAEYAVALFMYMRLLGYPAAKISILTMYVGQKALIRDVLGHRCKNNRLFGLPRIVSTVDRYQGEQNDCKLIVHCLSFCLPSDMRACRCHPLTHSHIPHRLPARHPAHDCSSLARKARPLHSRAALGV